MIVVAIVGVLAALAIYGVRKYLTNSKTAEARNALGQISKAAQAAFGKEEWANAGVIAPGSERGASTTMCPSAAAVPGEVPKSTKYQSAASDWDDDAGWACLRFSMSGPQYFQYEYTSSGSAADATFAAIARGDLDGDDETSSFTINGSVVEGTLTVSPAIEESNPEE
jgi:type IV pilus assembly protein PilA